MHVLQGIFTGMDEDLKAGQLRTPGLCMCAGLSEPGYTLHFHSNGMLSSFPSLTSELAGVPVDMGLYYKKSIRCLFS